MDRYDKAENPVKRMKGPDANYDYSSQVQPKKPMGHGQYANMPDGAMIREFPHKPTYRDGIVNGFTADLDSLSEIEENQC